KVKSLYVNAREPARAADDRRAPTDAGRRGPPAHVRAPPRTRVHRHRPRPSDRLSVAGTRRREALGARGPVADQQAGPELPARSARAARLSRAPAGPARPARQTDRGHQTRASRDPRHPRSDRRDRDGLGRAARLQALRTAEGTPPHPQRAHTGRLTRGRRRLAPRSADVAEAYDPADSVGCVTGPP